MDKEGGQAVFIQGQRFGRIHLDITETLVAEFRGEIHAIRPQVETVRHERIDTFVSPVEVADVVLVHVTVRIEPLPIPERNADTGFAPDVGRHVAGHVLAEVIDPASVIDPVEGYRRVLTAGPDGRHGLRDEFPRGRFPPACGLPGTVIETGFVPAVHFQTGVVALSRIDVVIDQGAVGTGLPGRVRGNGDGLPIGKSEPDVHPESGPGPPVGRMETPGGDGLVVVPTVAEKDAERVGSVPDFRRDIPCRVKDRLVESGERRIQIPVTDPFPIHIEDVEACRGNIGPGGNHLFFHEEFFPEIRGRKAVDILPVVNPFPVGAPQPHGTGLEEGDFGRNRLSAHFLHDHLPPIPGEGLQRRSRIGYETVIRNNGARIPHRALPLFHFFLVRAHQDPVRTLARPFPGVLHHPGKPRGRVVHADGTGKMLHLQRFQFRRMAASLDERNDSP